MFTKIEESGIAKYAARVYGWVVIGLLVTALSAELVYGTDLRDLFFHVSGPKHISLTIMGLIAILSPVVLAVIFGWKGEELPYWASILMFLGISATLGISSATTLFLFTGVSIASSFAIAASMFGGMAIFGLVTKRSLEGIGRFLGMALIGLVVAGLINLFFHSSIVNLITNLVAVLVFAGLSATDSQAMKDFYGQYGDCFYAKKMAVFFALSLYLDFLNLFQSILDLIGSDDD